MAKKKKSNGQGKGKGKQNSNKTGLSPEQQQERLKQIEAEISENVDKVLVGNDHRFRIGRLLSEARQLKKAIPHGDFKRWISEKWGGRLPYTTAISYKRVAEAFKDNPGIVSKLDWTLLDELARKKIPDTVRQLAVKNPPAFQKCKDKDVLRDAAKAYDKEEIDKKGFLDRIQAPSEKRAQKSVFDQLKFEAPRARRIIQRIRKEAPSSPDDRKTSIELLLQVKQDLEETLRALQQQEKAPKAGAKGPKINKRRGAMKEAA